MRESIAPVPGEPEGKRSPEQFQARRAVESVGKPVAIACLNGAIESFLAAHQMSRAQLAEDICGVSESNFSKLKDGKQGDFWAFVYTLPADIRADFFERLHETEFSDPLALALEQLQIAMSRVTRLLSDATPLERQRAAVIVGERRGVDRRRA